MVNDSNWWPSRELPSETHQRFSDLCQAKRPKREFWLPHEPGEKKQEWTDRVATGWYPFGVSSSGPGNSQRLWAEKDFQDPASILVNLPEVSKTCRVLRRVGTCANVRAVPLVARPSVHVLAQGVASSCLLSIWNLPPYDIFDFSYEYD
jgi:hypothetical protein